MKPFQDRNRLVVGAIGLTSTAAIALAALNYDQLPFLTAPPAYSAYFAEAGGLTEGADVQVSGLEVGKVVGVALDGDRVLVTFKVGRDVWLGDRSEAAIKTKALLGNKVLEVSPRGTDRLAEPIPLRRTTPAYQLPDALGDLSATISGLDTNQLSESLETMARTFEDTSPELKVAVEGVARFSRMFNDRDAQLRSLLTNASRVTAVLAERRDDIVRLVADTNSLLTELATQDAALERIAASISAVSRQINGFIDDNQDVLKPSLEKLNGALAIVENRKDEVQQSIRGLNDYLLALGETLASGPFFKAYLANLLPGQFIQPFVEAAFSDLGLDPSTLLPTERTDPQVGQPGTPALPVPYPRTGQGGAPALTVPDAITGNLGDSRYPYRDPSPAPGPGGPPPPAPAGSRARPGRGEPVTRNSLSLARIGLVLIFVAVLIGALLFARTADTAHRTHIVGYFDNSNGLFVGDQVRILGVAVGRIDRIEPEPHRTKIHFWVEQRYPVPAEVNAVILSPSLVTARAIQLTPAYTGGPVLQDNSVIGQERTAVPVEWDDFRDQLERITTMLAPTETGGTSTLGSFVDTAADNLRGRGADIRRAVLEMSQAIAALGDHSDDIFSTVRNLSLLTSALQGSTEVMQLLNQNLAGVTGRLATGEGAVGAAVNDLSEVVGKVRTFVTDNRETVGVTSDKLAAVSTTLAESLEDVKQTLHLAPTAAQNFINIYQPAQGTLTGVLAVGNFADPITFICGAVQAASRLGGEQAAKLCVQYLAPIVKNRQYNFPPLGVNPFVGTSARPNEVTYSEDWLRPDHAAPPPPQPLPAEAHSTDPAAGLPGLMVPPVGSR